MYTLMLLLLKKNIFQLCFYIKENDSIRIRISASNPLRILWHMASLRCSAEQWVWPRGYFHGEVLLPFPYRSHSKEYKFASYNKNINAFANILAISFPQAGKQNSADASPDDFTLMSIIYAIYLIWLYNTDHHKHCMFHSLSASRSMILEASWAWNHCAVDDLPSNPGGTNTIYDHKPCLIYQYRWRWKWWVLSKCSSVDSTEAEVKIKIKSHVSWPENV